MVYEQSVPVFLYSAHTQRGKMLTVCDVREAAGAACVLSHTPLGRMYTEYTGGQNHLYHCICFVLLLSSFC